MDAIASDPEILGGAPCFAGTRVPVKNLFDAIERGRTLDYFLSQFPTVTREQAVAMLPAWVAEDPASSASRIDAM